MTVSVCGVREFSIGPSSRYDDYHRSVDAITAGTFRRQFLCERPTRRFSRATAVRFCGYGTARWTTSRVQRLFEP
jgi:hypothetical protein